MKGYSFAELVKLAEAAMPIAGGTFTGNITAPNVFLSAAQSTDARAATRRDFVVGELDKKVARAGSTMSGALIIDGTFTGLSVRRNDYPGIELISKGSTAHRQKLIEVNNGGGLNFITRDSNAVNNGVVTISPGKSGEVYHTGNKPTPDAVLGTDGDYLKQYVIQKPAGAVDGKWYPILISNMSNAPLLIVRTRSSASTDPMNHCEFVGDVRSGGWTDLANGVTGKFAIYDSNERAIHSIVGGAESVSMYAIYVEARAFPVDIKVHASASVYCDGNDIPWGTSVFKAGIVPDPLNMTSYGTKVKMLQDFARGTGFYCSSTQTGSIRSTGNLDVTGPAHLSSVLRVGSLVAPNATWRAVIQGSSVAGEYLFGGNPDGSPDAIDYIRVGRNKLQYTSAAGTSDIYHANNKPTAADCKALALTGGKLTGTLEVEGAGIVSGGAIRHAQKSTGRGLTVSANGAGYGELVNRVNNVEEWNSGLRCYGGNDWRIGSNKIFSQAFKPTAADCNAVPTYAFSKTGQDKVGWMCLGRISKSDNNASLIISGMGDFGGRGRDIVNLTIASRSSSVTVDANMPKRTNVYGGMTKLYTKDTGTAFELWIWLPAYQYPCQYQVLSATGWVDMRSGFTITEPEGLVEWPIGTYYTTTNKPNSTDVGALALSGGTLTGPLILQSGRKSALCVYNKASIRFSDGSGAWFHNYIDGTDLVWGVGNDSSQARKMALTTDGQLGLTGGINAAGLINCSYGRIQANTAGTSAMFEMHKAGVSAAGLWLDTGNGDVNIGTTNGAGGEVKRRMTLGANGDVVFEGSCRSQGMLFEAGNRVYSAANPPPRRMNVLHAATPGMRDISFLVEWVDASIITVILGDGADQASVDIPFEYIRNFTHGKWSIDYGDSSDWVLIYTFNGATGALQLSSQDRGLIRRVYQYF